MRNYTAADIEGSASLWDPQNTSDIQLLETRAGLMADACRRHFHRRSARSGTAALPSGGWCLGQPHPIGQREPGVMRALPPGHEVADLGIVSVLLDRVLRTPDGTLLSLIDFGAGVGQFGRELLASQPSLSYAGYDGAGNVARRTQGFVRFFDLTVPLSLPKADWLMCLEVGEHIPSSMEQTFVRNVHAHNRCGIVLSWAPLDRYGISHVNNHSPEYVRALFEELGYLMDTELTKEIHHRAARSWMRDHVFVFRRRMQPLECSGLPGRG